MPVLTLEISLADANLLKTLTSETSLTTADIVSASIRRAYLETREDSGVTYLDHEAFAAFLKVLETPESDPKVLAARKQLMAFKPVWKNNSLVSAARKDAPAHRGPERRTGKNRRKNPRQSPGRGKVPGERLLHPVAAESDVPQGHKRKQHNIKDVGKNRKPQPRGFLRSKPSGETRNHRISRRKPGA